MSPQALIFWEAFERAPVALCIARDDGSLRFANERFRIQFGIQSISCDLQFSMRTLELKDIFGTVDTWNLLKQTIQVGGAAGFVMVKEPPLCGQYHVRMSRVSPMGLPGIMVFAEQLNDGIPL